MFLVGIAGGSGSGKTTFAKKVLAKVESNRCEILHQDSYYLDVQPDHNFTKSGKANFDSPDAFDWELLKNQLKLLKSNEHIHAPIYDFKTCSRGKQTVQVGPCEVLIVEGIFTLFDSEIRDLFDIKCFLKVDADIRFIRRLHRDVKERDRSLQCVIDQYYETVRPMYQKFLEPQKEYADFTVGEETDVAASILAAKINEILHSKTRN